jgi:transcriptional regulator GlxA family with amidase domain
LGQRVAFRSRSFNDLESLQPALPFYASAGTRTRQAGPSIEAVRIVRKFEEFFDKVGQDRVLISEVCMTLNVSRRTLHRAFHDVLGMGPLAFLKNSRLCSTRIALLNSEVRATNVAEAALQHGFEDAGRFSAYYFSLFGEYPSETLNRRHEIH